MLVTMTTDTTGTLSAPEHAGFTLRHWRGEEDYFAMTPVLIASRNADGIEEARTVEELKSTYARMTNFDVARNLFLAEHNGELVAYAGVRWSKEADANFIHRHWVFVRPEWRGRGIENELVRVAEQRLREIAQDHTHGATNWFEHAAYESQNWLADILRANDYQPERHFFDMVRPNLQQIPDIELPQGIEARPVRPDQYRLVWDAAGDAFAGGWGEPIMDEADYQSWLKKPNLAPELWQLAWDGDQVVGMVLNFVDHQENIKYGYKRGYTEDISVRKPWRGRGIAKALIVRSLRMFRDMGFDQTALGVDTENPSGALHLYESLGYEIVRRETVYRKRIETNRSDHQGDDD